MDVKLIQALADVAQRSEQTAQLLERELIPGEAVTVHVEIVQEGCQVLQEIVQKWSCTERTADESQLLRDLAMAELTVKDIIFGITTLRDMEALQNQKGS